MFDHFSLILMLTHACNLRCSYCYTGEKHARHMPQSVGQKAIDRAAASVAPGGVLDLGFFGGEPMLEASLMADLADYARQRVDNLKLGVTTNATVTAPAAWDMMLRDDMDLTLSCDGLPAAHDHHRLTAKGGATSATVEQTMRRLQQAGKPFGVNMVVRPDTVQTLPAGAQHLLSLGVRKIDLSLDLWCRWDESAAKHLETSIAQVASIWRENLPAVAINWFDEKAMQLTGVPCAPISRCGFGRGEIAVAPSGHLYPCERLIGADGEDNPMRLPAQLFAGDDFLSMPRFTPRGDDACDSCAMASACSTTCRCSNFVRTGNVATPDRLLCLLNEATTRATLRYMRRASPMKVNTIRSHHHEEVLR